MKIFARTFSTDPILLMNTLNNYNINNPLPWSQIDKLKWKKYRTRFTTFTELLSEEVLTLSPKVNALQGIYYSTTTHFSEDPEPYKNIPVHDNIYDLVSSKDLLRISYNKLKSNKGAMTPGSKGDTADSVSDKLINDLHISLKTRTFKWDPVIRIEVQKPGRAKGVTRPLGLPDFTNKMVQNNIMMILTSIYDPELEYLNSNFGFRPHKSPNDAIKKIRLQTNGMDIAIEGDIEGAYDNVEHPILIKILRKRIKDEKFIELVFDALKAGFMKEKTYHDTFLGMPQGGIHSPILFNIFMNEFDKFVTFQIPILIERWNQKNPSSSEANNDSSNTRRRIKRISTKTKLLNSDPNSILTTRSSEDYIYVFSQIQSKIPESDMDKSLVKNNIATVNNVPTDEEKRIFAIYELNRNKTKVQITKGIGDYSPRDQIIIKNLNSRTGTLRRIREKIKTLISRYNLQTQASEILINTQTRRIIEEKKDQLKLTALDPNKKSIDYKYYRYADDWILFTRGSLNTAKKLKRILEIWINNNLKLKLSPQKTLITEIRKEKAHFLGFEIFHQINKQVVRRKTPEGVVLQRYGKIQIMPDTNRLKNKFQIKNYLTKNDKIKSVGFLTSLQDHQIIEKYNQFMLGLGLYYITEISRTSALNYWHYVLYYSCLMTLAHKHKTSVSKIVKSGYIDISKPNIKASTTKGFDRRIISSYLKQDGTVKYQVLVNYNEFMMTLKPIREKFRNDDLYESFESPTIDFMILHKINWRTKFKLNTMCAICASTDQLQMHHIKHMKNKKTNDKTFNGFDQIVASIGRKQVCVCRLCHEKIHKGTYNKTSLRELIDVRVVAPEGLLKPPASPNSGLYSPVRKKPKGILINKEKKTYYNPQLAAYYKSNYEQPNIEND